MLMPGLVRTPIQHDSIGTINPFLKPFQILTSLTQDYRWMPVTQSMHF